MTVWPDLRRDVAQAEPVAAPSLLPPPADHAAGAPAPASAGPLA